LLEYCYYNYMTTITLHWWTPRESVVASKGCAALYFVIMHRHYSSLCKVNRTPSIRVKSFLESKNFLCPCSTVEWESKSCRREIFRKHEIDKAYWLDRILELFTQARSKILQINCEYVHIHTHTHTHIYTHTWLLFLHLRERGAKTKIAFYAAQVRARVSRRVVFKTHGRINYTFLNVPSIYFIVVIFRYKQDLTQRNIKYSWTFLCVWICK